VVIVDNSYLMIIEGAYGCRRHQWESLVGRRISLDWSDSCSHVTCDEPSVGSTTEAPPPMRLALTFGVTTELEMVGHWTLE
jgi:hypothetical protein